MSKLLTHLFFSNNQEVAEATELGGMGKFSHQINLGVNESERGIRSRDDGV